MANGGGPGSADRWLVEVKLGARDSQMLPKWHLYGPVLDIITKQSRIDIVLVPNLERTFGRMTVLP